MDEYSWPLGLVIDDSYVDMHSTERGPTKRIECSCTLKAQVTSWECWRGQVTKSKLESVKRDHVVHFNE